MSDDHVTVPDEPEPPGDGDQAGPASEHRDPAEPPVTTCHECGNPLEEGQPYCLECGAPTPWAPKLRRGVGPAGILAIGLLALGAGAGALAYAIANEDNTTAQTVTSPSTPTLLPSVGTNPFPTTPSVDQTNTQPFPSTSIPGTGTLLSIPSTSTPSFPTTSTPSFPSTSTPSVPSTPSTPTTPTTPSTSTPSTGSTPTTPPVTGGSDDWPDGRSGWTVILASTSSRSDATRFRDRVQATGRSAGLIDSSQYSTLQPDLWVVYTGVYSSRSSAISQAAALRGTYKGAYAQRIEA